MTQKFKVTGMSCNKCVSKVQKVISEIKGVESVNVKLDPPEAEIKMENLVDKNIFNIALEYFGDYKLEDEIH